MDVLDRIRVGQAAYGKGVYARRRLKKGFVIGEVTGEVIEDHEGWNLRLLFGLSIIRAVRTVALSGTSRTSLILNRQRSGLKHCGRLSLEKN